MNSNSSISHSLFLSVSSVHGLCVFGVYGRGVQHCVPYDLCFRPSHQGLAVQQPATSRALKNLLSKICRDSVWIQETNAVAHRFSCINSRAGTNTPSNEYDTYREYRVANMIRIANTIFLRG